MIHQEHKRLWLEVFRQLAELTFGAAGCFRWAFDSGNGWLQKLNSDISYGGSDRKQEGIRLRRTRSASQSS
jgi:hypothetical protein